MPSGWCGVTGMVVPPILDAILELMPLDAYVEAPIALMAVAEENLPEPEIWSAYRTIVQKHEPDNHEIEQMERFAFYERAKRAYAIVATGESAI